MKRILKASLLGLVLAVAAGCPTPGHRASTDSSYAQVPAPAVQTELPEAE